MIQIIAGEKGKGKTKQLLDKVNTEIKTAHGSIVYLDKNAKHMYELNNKIRLIDTSAFPIGNSSHFIGFRRISQDDYDEIPEKTAGLSHFRHKLSHACKIRRGMIS